MENGKKNVFKRTGYLVASFLPAIIILGLFVLPFFRMQGIFLSFDAVPIFYSGFATMGLLFFPGFIAYDATSPQAAQIDALIELSMVGAIFYWLMLAALIALSILIILSFAKKKTYLNSVCYLAIMAFSFAGLVVFSFMAKNVNVLYQTYYGIGFTNYVYFSGTMPIFLVSALSFIVMIIYEQTVLDKKKRYIENDAAYLSASGEPYGVGGNDMLFQKEQGEKRAFAVQNTVARYDLSVGLRNSDTISVTDRMPDIIKKVGLPQFVDEQLTAYWWRSARTRTEYLTNKLSDVTDCELKIVFSQDKTVQKIVFNTNCGLFKNKNVKDQVIVGKAECYATNGLEALKECTAEMRFYDGSFLKVKSVNYKLPVQEEGIAEVYWETDGLSFHDKINISASLKN